VIPCQEEGGEEEGKGERKRKEKRTGNCIQTNPVSVIIGLILSLLHIFDTRKVLAGWPRQSRSTYIDLLSCSLPRLGADSIGL
jgi:hypothetical protein